MSIEDEIDCNTKAIEEVMNLLALLLGDREFPAKMLPTGACGLAKDGSVLRKHRGWSMVDRYEFRDGKWSENPWSSNENVMVRLVDCDYMSKTP